MSTSNGLNRLDDEVFDRFERAHRISLPTDFRSFLRASNGGGSECKVFAVAGVERVIERFLVILADPSSHEQGCYDIAVVITQIGARLAKNADELGCKLIPFAALFAGDFLCLDFRGDAAKPSVVVWDHERSDDFKPYTVYVDASFADFMQRVSPTPS